MCIILKIVGLVEKADKEKAFEAKNSKWKEEEKHNISYFQQHVFFMLRHCLKNFLMVRPSAFVLMDFLRPFYQPTDDIQICLRIGRDMSDIKPK